MRLHQRISKLVTAAFSHKNCFLYCLTVNSPLQYFSRFCKYFVANVKLFNKQLNFLFSISMKCRPQQTELHNYALYILFYNYQKV